METTIYVELMEGSAEPIFAPVPAIYLGQRFYRIGEHGRKDYDTLRFNTGTCVVALMTKLSAQTDLVPVAYCDIPKEAVEYILNFDKSK